MVWVRLFDLAAAMGQVFGRTGVAEPAYEVLYKNSENFSYEIRKYGVRYVAEASYSGDDNSPFMLLAKYIGVFGNPENEGQKAISMTAPVIKESGTKIAMTAPVMKSDSQQGGLKVMDFVLPAEYDSMEKIPKPTNPAVKIKEIPAAVGAVHRFSGSMEDNVSREMAKELATQLEKDGVDMSVEHALENYQFWGYNPPFTLPMFRRNEVWIELEQSQVDAILKNEAGATTSVN